MAVGSLNGLGSAGRLFRVLRRHRRGRGLLVAGAHGDHLISLSPWASSSITSLKASWIRSARVGV